MATIVELVATAPVHASASAGCELTRGATGRITRSIEPDEVTDDLLVAEWTRVESLQAMLVHPAANRFSGLVDAHPQHARGTLQAFRGRPRKETGDEPTSSNFGPAPDTCTGAGRYNEIGRPVLYLASTPKGVWDELNHGDPRPLFCQEYTVDLSAMRILDATWTGLHNFLHLAWDAAERHDLPGYTFSRAVAHLVRAAGFEGMLVPGVRGTPESRYRNLVVFQPEPHWQEWLAPGREPFALDEVPQTSA